MLTSWKPYISDTVIEAISSAIDFVDSIDYFNFFLYSVICQDCNGDIWIKIGKSKQVDFRLSRYQYRRRFEMLGISKVTSVEMVAFEHKEDHDLAEKYMHKSMKQHRVNHIKHIGIEWFTNAKHLISPSDFMALFNFHRFALASYGHLLHRMPDGEWATIGGYYERPDLLYVWHGKNNIAMNALIDRLDMSQGRKA